MVAQVLISQVQGVSRTGPVGPAVLVFRRGPRSESLKHSTHPSIPTCEADLSIKVDKQTIRTQLSKGQYTHN